MRYVPLAVLALASFTYAEDEVSFFHDVRPILQAHCVGCHQPAKPQGDVVLTRFADILEPELVAPMVVPHRPDESVLIEVITPVDDLGADMPKDVAPLAQADIDLLRRWIEEGARDDSPPVRPRTELPIYVRPPVITSLDHSPDGRTLAISGRGEVLLHSADGKELLGRLVGLSDRIESVAFSPDGKHLAVAGGSPALMGELQVWNVESAELALSVPVGFDTIHGVSWSADGMRIAFGCKDNTVRAVDAKTGKQLLYQGAHEDWVLGTTFSSDDSHLVSVSRDRSMKLIKVESQQFIDNITSITPGVLKGGLLSVRRHPTSDQLLVGGADGVPKIFRMYREEKRVIGDDYNLIRAFDAMYGRVHSAVWSPDGTRIAAGSSLRESGELRVYSVEDGEKLWGRPICFGVYVIDYHPTDGGLVTAGFDGFVRVFDGETGEPVREFMPFPIVGLRKDLIEASADTETP